MAGLGDLSTSLEVDVTSWIGGFAEANTVLDGFASNFSASMDGVSQASRQIGAVAGAAAISIGSIGTGLVAVGGSGSALFAVSRTLLGIGGIANNLSTAINNLKSGTTYTQKLVGSIGAIGAGAGIAALSLRGVSAAMAKMGQDTTKIDSLTKSIGRVATAATIAVLGIKAIGIAIRTMQSVASAGIGVVNAGFSAMKATLKTIPASIGLVAGSLRTLGSTGVGAIRSGTAAIGSFAANAGDALGKVGQGVASVATGFAFGGVLGGLATAAGLLVASGASLDSLGIKGTAAEGPLLKIKAGLVGIGEWLGKIAGGVATAAMGALSDMAQRGQGYFTSFLQAIQPLTDAIQNVWLPAVIGSTEGANSSFAAFFDYIESAWGGWIYDSIAAMAEFVGNIDLYFQIAQQSVVLWASNSILQVSDFFNNIGTWLDWFGENWSDVLFTASDVAMTVFINIGQNIRNIFTEIWEWVSSGFTSDINIDWTPLTEGFVSSIKEWPDLIDTELATATPELEALYGQLGKRQAAAKERGNAITDAKSAMTPKTKEEEKKAESQKTATGNTLALRGSADAVKSIMANAARGNDPQQKLVAQGAQQLSEMKKQTALLAKQQTVYEQAFIGMAIG